MLQLQTNCKGLGRRRWRPSRGIVLAALTISVTITYPNSESLEYKPKAQLQCHWTTTEGSGFNSRQSSIYVYSASSTPDLEPTQPPSQRLTGSPSPGLRWGERQAHHSPRWSVDAKKFGAVPPLPHAPVRQPQRQHLYPLKKEASDWSRHLPANTVFNLRTCWAQRRGEG
jgi:hypothetical protein